jgi:hypothetical protein
VPTTFDYDVAISFAGEQRADAEAIATCLRSTGVSVFYDQYEAANLWGKNLYDHLATVYHHQARYCLMLVSAAYAAKVWTTHERQSAQARALAENTEYILPVRFDDTPIPGLLPTIGYISFREYGVQGICQLLLQKLGKHTGTERAVASVSTSPRACILDVQQNLQSWPPVTACDWGTTEAAIVFQPDDPTDPPFLESLRGARNQLLIAFKHDAGLCRVQDAQHILRDGNDQWRLRLRVERADFTPTMEVGMQGLTADQLAEQRARRILLNEYPPPNPKDWNKALEEVLRRGMETVVQPTASPFPALYERYANDPMMFLETAWITAVMTLKTSGTVAEVTTLRLTIDGPNLGVAFVGKRRKQYTNQPASTIAINGRLLLVP